MSKFLLLMCSISFIILGIPSICLFSNLYMSQINYDKTLADTILTVIGYEYVGGSFIDTCTNTTCDTRCHHERYDCIRNYTDVYVMFEYYTSPSVLIDYGIKNYTVLYNRYDSSGQVATYIVPNEQQLDPNIGPIPQLFTTQPAYYNICLFIPVKPNTCNSTFYLYAPDSQIVYSKSDYSLNFDIILYIFFSMFTLTFVPPIGILIYNYCCGK